MKNLLSLFLILQLLLFSCSEDNNKLQKPIDQLPPATQTGANTAGCLVNGEAFLPKGTSLGGPVLSCFYQRNQVGYHLGLSISSKSSGQIKTVQFGTNLIELVGNTTYNLVEKKSDINNNYISNYGEYYILSITNGDTYFTTTNTVTGELKITKLDTQQRIISGTFWFDAINANNEKVQVREGRFDMHYVN